MLGCLLLPELYVLYVLFLFFPECGERESLYQSMRPRMDSYQDEALPLLSRQLGIVVEVEVDLEER